MNAWRRRGRLLPEFGCVCGLLLGSCGGGDAGPERPLRPPPLVISARLPAPASPPAPPPPAAPLDARAGATPSARTSEDYPSHGVAFHVLAQVHAAPSADAPVIAYMRRGARFRARGPVRGGGCEGGWYALRDGGHVCRGRGFTLGASPQSFEPSPAPPDRQGFLPYPYAKTVPRDVMQYWRVPTAAERLAAKEGLAAHRAQQAALAEAASKAPEVERPAPDPAAAGGPGDDGSEPTPQAEKDAPPRLLPDFVRMPMEPGFYVSLDNQPTPPEGAAADFARTVRGALVQRDALAPAELPALRGQVLEADTALPLGLVFRTRARRFTRDARTRALTQAGELPRYGAAPLRQGEVQHEGTRYALLRDGGLVGRHAIRLAVIHARPAQVPKGARWVHVSLAEQVLVAYEGERPVFATLVSTGKEGFETPMGLFRIHAKHVSTTMDGAEGTDEVYSIEDVPWTMYFHGSIALHAAFWHDRFGRTRSHGCVNLAPADAQWLFQWSTPAVPPGQHGVMPRLSDPTTYVLVE